MRSPFLLKMRTVSVWSMNENSMGRVSRMVSRVSLVMFSIMFSRFCVGRGA